MVTSGASTIHFACSSKKCMFRAFVRLIVAFMGYIGFKLFKDKGQYGTRAKDAIATEERKKMAVKGPSDKESERTRSN